MNHYVFRSCCLPCWKVSSLRAGIMYKLLNVVSTTLSSVPDAEHADKRRVLHCLRERKLSILRTMCEVFTDLVSNSISGPDSCPPVLCFVPLKHLQFLKSPACICTCFSLPLACPPTFVCLSNYLSSLQIHLKGHLLREAISNDFRQNAVLLLYAPAAPSNFSSTLFIKLLKNTYCVPWPFSVF